MTELAVTPAPARTGLALPLRIALLVVASLVLLFCVGLVIGIATKLAETGLLKPRGAALLGGAVVGAGLAGWACWSLSSHWRQPNRSAYERRYARMLLLLFATGLPVGLLIGMAGEGRPEDSLFSNGPLDPTLAGLAAASLVLLLGSGIILYHRAIDDHEQQAYLWANSLAFYFLAIALPVAWLLSRGGLIGPIGIGSAMLILVGALVINLTTWAWLKFR
jgi:hypothetical protein